MKSSLFMTMLLFCLFSHAQVAINTDGTNAHTSGVLDLKSTSKGMLIPRVTTAQRTAIASPAHGLMVFDKDYESFFFFISGGGGWKQLHNSEDGALLKLPFNGQANAGIRLFTLNNLGSGGVASFTVNNANDTFTVSDIIQKGKGVALNAQVTNTASTSSIINLLHKGNGSGLKMNIDNPSNGAHGIDVYHAGNGTGVLASSQNGNGIWGITASTGHAAVLGDNTAGEALVGRSWGGQGIGAVVGRNSSTGYGVRGFNTDDGIGVLGQAGIGGGQAIAGRFENIPNTTTGNFSISDGRAAQFLYLSGSNWIPVQ